MKPISLAALAAPVLVQAGLRFGCSTLTIQRIDPVVEPGAAPAAHLHHIVGGGHFNMTMEGDIGAKDSCTTCVMAEDLSNVRKRPGTAVLYFKARNGSYHRVPVINNAALDRGTVGGMTIYYTPFDFTTDGLKTQGRIRSFPPGFRMTVGSPTTNTLEQAQKHVGLRYNCLQTLTNRGRELADLPTGPCPAGIFAIHHFPACWDGKNLDSPNHQDHMYNTIVRDGFTNAPACPASHPVRMPQLTYETVWDTTKFNDKSLWPEDGRQPFVWSYTSSGTEKTNGYGTHADYMFGWQGDSLQRAMDQNDCFYDGCGSLKKQTMAEANKCKVREMVVGDNIDGWVDQMPGQK